MRFPIRVDPWWYPLLALFGVSSPRAYVAVEDDVVAVRFGFYKHRLRRDNVVAAGPVRRGWWYRVAAGIGWHTDFATSLAVNGSLAGLVELQLATPERGRLLGIPMRFTRLWISLEQPRRFPAGAGPVGNLQVGSRRDQPAPPARPPSSRRGRPPPGVSRRDAPRLPLPLLAPVSGL